MFRNKNVCPIGTSMSNMDVFSIRQILNMLGRGREILVQIKMRGISRVCIIYSVITTDYSRRVSN